MISANGPRIALYSHDTMGLGHIRRNQLIAKALAGSPLNASVLLITGIREGGAFVVPRGIDSMSLPAYHKGVDGTYSARSLDMSAEQLRRLRADLIEMALMRFEPDLFIADNVPRGALDELVPALRLGTARNTRRSCYHLPRMGTSAEFSGNPRLLRCSLGLWRPDNL
jgi:predicted glycosyltransferase